MINPSIDHEQVVRAFAELRKLPAFTTFNPRQFVDADLDQLAANGIFPENDFLLSFQAHTEAKILPICWNDSAAFDGIMKLNVGIFGEAFEQMVQRYHFDALWAENVHFFVYCFCMILRCGRGTNPYFGLADVDGYALNAAFRHLIEDDPIATIPDAGFEACPWAPNDISEYLRHRWFVRPDGTLNRNAVKQALVELEWIYRSDFCNKIVEKISVFDSLSPAKRIVYGETFLNDYLTALLLRYLGLTLTSQDWFIDHAFPILEDFLARCESQEKQNRHEMRVKFTELTVSVSHKIGKPVEKVLFLLARCLAEPTEFRKITGARSMLDAMYYGCLVCEFVCDVYPLETAKK